MKFALTAILATAVGCTSSPSRLRFDSARPLIALPDRQLGFDELEPLLDELFGDGKPVVVYVHGRGNEPGKSFRWGILHRIESQYGVRVLMLNWRAKAPALVFGRPVEHAQAAAPHFRELVQRLARYREARPAAASARAAPLSLLVHSMGNLVLEQAMADGGGGGDAFMRDANGRPVFSNVLLTQSDADAGPHARWVKRLPAAGTVLVTLNRRDVVLARSRRANGEQPLGRSDPAGLSLARNAVYLDLTGIVGGHHRVFAKGAQGGNVAVCRIMTAMLRGEQVNLNVGQTVARVDRDRVITPLAARDRRSACFSGAEAMSEGEELADHD